MSTLLSTPMSIRKIEAFDWLIILCGVTLYSIVSKYDPIDGLISPYWMNRSATFLPNPSYICRSCVVK